MKENKKLKIAIIVIICVIVVIGLCMHMFLDKNTDYKSTGNNDIKCIEIETPYETLAFPKEMEDEVIIKKENKEDFILQFYGDINDKEELLMDIAFGREEGTIVGYYSVDDKQIPITVTYHEPQNIDELDNDEIIRIQEIHMASEYVIYNLSKSKNFISVE